MGGGQNLLKISAPLQLAKIYQMKPRVALSISLDSTLMITFPIVIIIDTGNYRMQTVYEQWTLKVPSGQIGSKWEWYHWKALEKDMNRYKFLIF
jgi:hypothetical protein